MKFHNVEDLLNKPYWIVDVLPEQVPENSRGQYAAIEQYYLDEPQRTDIHKKYANIVLRLNCCSDLYLSVDAGGHWEENPAPEKLIRWILNSGINGMVQVLFKEENTLIMLNRDDTYMTVFDPSEELLDRIRVLAQAEGLFVWKPPV